MHTQIEPFPVVLYMADNAACCIQTKSGLQAGSAPQSKNVVPWLVPTHAGANHSSHTLPSHKRAAVPVVLYIVPLQACVTSASHAEQKNAKERFGCPMKAPIPRKVRLTSCNASSLLAMPSYAPPFSLVPEHSHARDCQSEHLRSTNSCAQQTAYKQPTRSLRKTG